MIAYLNGKITYKCPTYIYLDIGGIAYHVNISLHTYAAIEEVEESKVFIHHQVKGIGPKTAKRIILDLKDKLAKMEMAEGKDSTGMVVTASSSVREEAISALVSLGFNKAKVTGSVDKAIAENGDDVSVEALIKQLLRQLS